MARLKALPRYQPTTTRIFGVPLEIVDAASFLYMYGEIFKQQIYRFQASCEKPYIIDCGSNIGLSVLYFKQLYPKSHIICFEPDPKVFTILEKNIKAFGCDDVELVQRALWSSETALSFMSEGADGGRIARTMDSGNQIVFTVRLRDWIQRQVDFLKLDIEGGETEVLVDCTDLLSNVRHLFVEYHSFADEPQTLNVILGILADAGFRVHMHTPFVSPQPFMHRRVHMGMDIQLNIFAFRP